MRISILHEQLKSELFFCENNLDEIESQISESAKNAGDKFQTMTECRD